jgi:hypothetical protein
MGAAPLRDARRRVIVTISVTLLDEAGAPLPEGLGVELLSEGEVVAEGRIDGRGTVTFAGDLPRPLRVRLRTAQEVVARRPPGA